MTNIQLDPLWSFTLPKERRVNARAPVVSGGRVYSTFFYDRGGFTESRLLVFELGSGKELWSYVLGHVGNEPVVSGDTVYWSSFEGSVYALDSAGTLLWKGPGTKSNIGIPAVDTDRLVVAEIAGGASTTWCLDRRTGSKVWQFKNGGHAYPVAVAAGRIFHSSAAATGVDEPSKCTFYCISLSFGRVLWSVSGGEYYFNPLVLGDRVHVCSSRALRIFGATDGKVIGELKLEAENAALNVSAGPHPHRLYVRRDRHGEGASSLRAIDLKETKGLFGGPKVTPSVAWTLHEKRGLCGPAAQFPAGALVYLTHDGVLCFVDSTSGVVMAEKKLKTKPSSFGGICLSDGLAVISHGRGLFAFTIAGAQQRAPADGPASRARG